MAEDDCELICIFFLKKMMCFKYHFCRHLFSEVLSTGSCYYQRLRLKKNKWGLSMKAVQSWHLLCFQRLLKSQGLYYSCLPCWCHICSSCCCRVLLIACVFRSDDLSLCQAAVFNPGQLHLALLLSWPIWNLLIALLFQRIAVWFWVRETD